MSEIHQAAQAGNLDALRCLIAAGVPVDAYDEDSGHTPLMVACMSPQAGMEVLEFLIDSGADVNAPVKGKELADFDMDSLMESDFVDEETRGMLKQFESMRGSFIPEDESLPLVVLKEASLEKLKLLFERGADLQARSSNGYTLAINATCAGRTEVMDYLIAAGAPLDGVTNYGESVLRILSREGRFGEVHRLLAHGADPNPLGWTPLMHAVVAGDISQVKALVENGADLESVDYWERTAFLLAIHAGSCEIAGYFLAKGARRDAKGRCGRPAMAYPASRNDARTLQWLLDRAFDPDEADQFGHPPLKEAVEAGSIDCVRLLLDAGADWHGAAFSGEPLINSASEPEIIRMLVERGEELADLEGDALRSFIGLGKSADLPVSREEYLAGRFRRFGAANPERMDIPFWKAMVRCGWNAYQAAKQFGDSSFGRGEPVWCYDRFGMSLTALPDGRFIQIAGEHEDHYDPDFCIYNEVFIHDGKGGFEILGYPEEVFPPTDFHSATLVGTWIYIIGNLGYSESRKIGRTPVYRLDTVTCRIEVVATSGEEPGWIHRHRAVLEDGKIRISGGEIQLEAEDGSQSIEDHNSSYWFDPASGRWERIDE
jgi:ankyrin repeat protein